jgi:hypothetical protein
MARRQHVNEKPEIFFHYFATGSSEFHRRRSSALTGPNQRADSAPRPPLWFLPHAQGVRAI